MLLLLSECLDKKSKLGITIPNFTSNHSFVWHRYPYIVIYFFSQSLSSDRVEGKNLSFFPPTNLTENEDAKQLSSHVGGRRVGGTVV